MGRKKKGVLSHDQLVKDLEANKVANTPRVNCGDEEDAKETLSKVGRGKAKKVATETSQAVTVEKSSVKERAYDEDVFEDIAEIDDDMNELTRLMSCVDIADDPLEIEKQTNLAGVRIKIFESNLLGQVISAYHEFLIRLSPSIHPAIRQHLIELFKGMTSFPKKQPLEIHPSITPTLIEDKLQSLSEQAGTSFGLILGPPSFSCLKCATVLLPQIALATNVMVFGLDGPRIATKYRYRCTLQTYKKTLVT